MSSLTFFHTPLTCSTASHIALEEAGAAYDNQIVKLWKPEEHEKYRATINPRGSVPALRIGEQLLSENVAIMTYVAATNPDMKLLPRATIEHAQSIDNGLDGKTWVMGDQFTVADGYALVFYNWGAIDERPMQELKNFTAFKDRMLARPAVRRALERERSPLLA